MNNAFTRAGAATCFVIGTMALAFAQDQRAIWNTPQAPFRVYGNTYFVGTRGLSVLLIASDDGHVLIDGALPESVPGIVASIKTLGFRVEDVKLILNSHVHYDHAGGIGALQQASGAKVAAAPRSAGVLQRGESGPDDPQYGLLPPIDAVKKVQIVNDGETLRVGSLVLTAHATGGHTPGGTSWTWRSCQDGRCLDMVYADSLTPVSADAFRFTASKDYPDAVRNFEKAFSTLRAIPCDVLVTTHPEASDLWTRLASRDRNPDALIDRAACRRYADTAEGRLRTRVAEEGAAKPQP